MERHSEGTTIAVGSFSATCVFAYRNQPLDPGAVVVGETELENPVESVTRERVEKD